MDKPPVPAKKVVSTKLVLRPVAQAKSAEPDESVQGADDEEYGTRSAQEINALMMRAVASDAPRVLRRLIEERSVAWLGSSQSLSDTPTTNPVLAAILSPHGTRCADEFNAVYADVRKWTFGRWLPAHWAIAYKNEGALEWTLKGAGERHGPSLMDFERCDSNSMSKACRSGLALAAQMGDPDWLAKVLEVAVLSGASIEDMACSDRAGQPSAVATAIFAMSEAAREGAPKEEQACFEACARLLVAKGFPSDGMLPAGKLVCALALRPNSDSGENKAMAGAVRLAMELGSGAWAGSVPAGAFEAAGLAMDSEWARALLLCGFSEPVDGSFALGMSKRMKMDLFGGRPFEWTAQAQAFKLVELLRKSLVKAPLNMATSPLGGLELETARWAFDRAKGRSVLEPEKFLEKVEMALAVALSPASRPDALKSGSLRI